MLKCADCGAATCVYYAVYAAPLCRTCYEKRKNKNLKIILEGNIKSKGDKYGKYF